MNETFELSPELLQAIAPNVSPEKAQVKFDAKGTLHVLERGEDGSLVQDYAFNQVEQQILKDMLPSKQDELELKKQDNKEWRFWLRVFTMSLLSLLVPCIYLVVKSFNVQLGEVITLIVMLLCSVSIGCYSLITLIRKRNK